jgi:hypothetical protein
VLANPGQDADPNRAVEEFDRPRVGDDAKFAVLKGKLRPWADPTQVGNQAMSTSVTKRLGGSIL